MVLIRLSEARSAAVGQLDLFVKLEADERKKEQEQLIAKLKADVLASLKGQARAVMHCHVAHV